MRRETRGRASRALAAFLLASTYMSGAFSTNIEKANAAVCSKLTYYDSLGSLSAKYESGEDPAAIGYDNTGGYSYGLYQIADKVGTLTEFMTFLQQSYPDQHSRLLDTFMLRENSAADREAFNAAWKQLAVDHRTMFIESQRVFIKTKFYDVAACSIVTNLQLDVNDRSKALQNVLWSTAVQHGPTGALNVFKSALLGQSMSSIRDADIINLVYQERGADEGMKYFSRSTEAVRQAVLQRFVNENHDALVMLSQELTPPAAPIVNTITDRAAAVTGKAEAGSRVYVKAGTVILGTGAAAADGMFAVSIPVQQAGTKVSVIVKSTAGVYSPYTTVIVKDQTAPAAPRPNAVTNESTRISGTAEAGSRVYVKAGSTVIGKGSVTSSGSFSVAIPVQKAGTKLGLVVRDAAGNYSTYTYIKVQSVTAAPIVNIVTNQSTAVTGKAEAGSRVYVKAGSALIGTGTTASNGTFAVAIPVQKAGTRVSVTVKSTAGVYSPYTTVVVRDQTAPLAPQPNDVTDESTAVSGTAEAGSRVYVKAGSTVIGRATVASSGKFAVAIPVQKAGVKLGLVVRDTAGNYSAYTYIQVLDVTPAPVVNTITAQTAAVTGKAEAGSRVYVKVGSTVIGIGTTASNGTFSIAIPVQKAGTKVGVITKSTAGIYSPYTVSIVK